MTGGACTNVPLWLRHCRPWSEMIPGGWVTVGTSAMSCGTTTRSRVRWRVGPRTTANTERYLRSGPYAQQNTELASDKHQNTTRTFDSEKRKNCAEHNAAFLYTPHRREPWSMTIVDCRSSASTFWSFVLGHDNFKLSGASKAKMIGGHCLLGADHTYKDGSIVSISNISEVTVSNCSSLMLLNLQLYNNSCEWKKLTF